MVERMLRALCLLLLVGVAGAQEPTPAAVAAAPLVLPAPAVASIRVEPANVRQGDEAALVVELPDGAKATSLTFSPAEAQASALALGTPTSTDGGASWRVPVRFLSLETTTLQPGEIEAAVGDKATTFSTAELPLAIMPPEIPAGDLKDWTALMAAPFSWMRAAKKAALYGAIAAAIVLPVVALFFWLRRRKPQAAIASATARTPLEELDLELVDLRSLSEFRARGAEAHYTRLSMALRRYFEGTGQFAAVEMSDDEVLVHLRHRLAGRPAAALLAPIFDAGSLAKFARHAVSEADAREHLDAATAFCADERDRLRAQIAAAGRAA